MPAPRPKRRRTAVTGWPLTTAHGGAELHGAKRRQRAALTVGRASASSGNERGRHPAGRGGEGTRHERETGKRIKKRGARAASAAGASSKAAGRPPSAGTRRRATGGAGTARLSAHPQERQSRGTECDRRTLSECARGIVTEGRDPAGQGLGERKRIEPVPKGAPAWSPNGRASVRQKRMLATAVGVCYSPISSIQGMRH